MRDEAGSVTVEAALALSSLVIVVAGIVGAIATMAGYIAAVDAAGAAARANAIGADYRPPNARVRIDVTESGGLVTAEATAAGIVDTRARAIYPAEVGQG